MVKQDNQIIRLTGNLKFNIVCIKNSSARTKTIIARPVLC